MRFVYDAAGNLETLAQPGSPPTYTSDEVHQMVTDSRRRMSVYAGPYVGLANHTTRYDFTLDGELDVTTRPTHRSSTATTMRRGA